MRRLRLALAPLVLAAALAGLAVHPALASGDDAWDRLRAARDALAEAGPLVADFEQTYLPAGFDSGERESGRLTVALPDCLRWDYLDPFPKSFLVCGEVVHSWNPGETSGRRDRVDAETAPGLDLLLLSVDRLRARYRAHAEPAEEGRAVVRLDPLAESRAGDPTAFRDARLVLDAETGRPRELSYRDPEGNLTRFDLSGYRPLDDPGALAPPSGIDWIGD